MTRLQLIQSTVQQIAVAISAAMGLDTEIIDDDLNIIAGTGCYSSRTGQKEEGGDKEAGYIYGQLLKSGKTYINTEGWTDPTYGARDNELAEICCPIVLDDEVLGLIALVAFNQKQKQKLLDNSESNLTFLLRMASLIASKISQVEKANALNVILETIRDGILAVDAKGVITSCNATTERLMGTPKEVLLGKPLAQYWKNIPLSAVLEQKSRYDEHEEIYHDKAGRQRHFLVTVDPIVVHPQGTCTGAVITFRGFHDVKKMIYNMTELQQSVRFDDILGNGEKIKEAVDRARIIADSNSTVLITGESGTGKELFARAIHYESRRSGKPFITVNCGAIPESLLESELFGYEGGAFTDARKSGKAGKFELAHRGTIFLDEIGDLPLRLQVKLLHALQRREIERVGGNQVISVDVRVIAATNRDLTQMMQDREFREDLYFRLCVIPLHIPPLRERRNDIEMLLYIYLDKFNLLLSRNIQGFEPDALELLTRYDWPGNVRELENAMEYSVSLEKGHFISCSSIQPRIQQSFHHRQHPVSLKESLDAFQRDLIANCLAKTGCSLLGKQEAAAILGISESTLYRRIRELNITDRLAQESSGPLRPSKH